MAFAKTLKERQLSIYCDFCFRNITLDTYFRCEDCRFDSCLMCFFAEIETAEHKSSHSFRVVSNLTKQLLYDGWRLIDELLLIDGMITYGFGNFDDVSKIIVSKTETDVRRHFFGLINVNDDEDGEVMLAEVPKSNPNDSFVLSYMSKRKEFDSEILNEYESLIETLRFEEDDTEPELEFKRHLLYHYKTVLKRRKIWRNFVLGRNLIDVSQLKAKDHLELGEVASKLKWTAQFLSKNDFNILISGLLKEKKLKHALSVHPLFSVINENKLLDNSKFLSDKEKELCEKLKIAQPIYIKLKKMALEYYMQKKPLIGPFLKLFSDTERTRAMTLYKWFADQKIVIAE